MSDAGIIGTTARPTRRDGITASLGLYSAHEVASAVAAITPIAGCPTLASGAAAPVPVALPRSIGPYRVVSELDRGGMGVLYLALDPRLERVIERSRDRDQVVALGRCGVECVAHPVHGRGSHHRRRDLTRSHARGGRSVARGRVSRAALQ